MRVIFERVQLGHRPVTHQVLGIWTTVVHSRPSLGVHRSQCLDKTLWELWRVPHPAQPTLAIACLAQDWTTRTPTYSNSPHITQPGPETSKNPGPPQVQQHYTPTKWGSGGKWLAWQGRLFVGTYPVCQGHGVTARPWRSTTQKYAVVRAGRPGWSGRTADMLGGIPLRYWQTGRNTNVGSPWSTVSARFALSLAQC